MTAERRADRALVRRAVAEIAIVVVLGEHLDKRRRDADRSAHRREVELVRERDPGTFTELRDQSFAKVPERSTEDHAGVMDLADVLRPEPLLLCGIEVAEWLAVAEESAAHSVIVRDACREEVSRAFAHRT